MKLKINFLFIHLSIYCTHYTLAKPIVGPNVRSAVENEFPFVVSIMKVPPPGENRVPRNHRCTASFVSRQDVITAAHCLQNAMQNPIVVVHGSYDIMLATDYYPLFTLIYEHWALDRRITPQFTRNDIGFVKILTNIPENIPFATIGNAPSNVLYGLDVVSAGWGLVANNTIPRIFQVTDLKLLTPSECRQRIIRHEMSVIYIHERRLCTVGDPYAVLSHGDSGGPLLYFGSLIGVNTGVCPVMGDAIHPDQVNMHISVRFYYDFITDVTTRLRMNY